MNIAFILVNRAGSDERLKLYCVASHLGLHGLAFQSRKGKENLNFKGNVRTIQKKLHDFDIQLNLVNSKSIGLEILFIGIESLNYREVDLSM